MREEVVTGRLSPDCCEVIQDVLVHDCLAMMMMMMK